MTKQSLAFLGRATLAGCALVLIISLPFLLFGVEVTGWVEENMASTHVPAYLATLIIALLVLDIVLPIPSSLLCVAAFSLLTPISAFLTVSAGLTAAYVLGHFIGARVGTQVLARVFAAKEMGQLKRWTLTSRYAAIALSRPLPVLAEATSLYLGSIGTPLLPATLCAALSSLGLAAMYGWVAHTAQSQESLWVALLASIVLPGVFWGLSRVLRRRASDQQL